MSFHHTARNWRIHHDNGETLFRVELRDVQGNWHERTVRLDDHIGNTDGWFIWGGNGFTRTARNVRLEDTEWGPKLVAVLESNGGGDRGDQGMLLGDKIKNEDGHLRFTGP
ncbi:Cyanovirin-N [Aspergillus coremiiformis]|uniref:Cyanovirin-N n=1 Tax=Aspergillus coremiiformis TaxID=138285 RepID=A0A5N6Z3A9_9EURO|nr:Cyanovirin-N [Aspergillus coremiiformis]